MTKVKIKQFKNKAKEPVAGLTPEHAIYDANGVRLDAKLGNVNLSEFRKAQDNGIKALKNQEKESLKILREYDHETIINNGTINNAADEEDITVRDNVLSFKDRTYTEGINEMGYIILRKNKSFAEQVTKENTIYEIRYDFDLNGTEITIPEGCVLKFLGGAISNGILNYNKTKIEGYYYKHLLCSCTGTIENEVVTPELYGALGDNISDDTLAIQTAINNNTCLTLSKEYLITKPLYIDHEMTIRGRGKLTKINDITRIIDGKSFNAILSLEYPYINLMDLRLSGSIENHIIAILFAKSSNNINIDTINITGCEYGTFDNCSAFLVNFNRVHCQSCLNAFYFGSNIDKTSLTFKNCWAENCGQAYEFKRVVYSTLINCAADWCNYTGEENPYNHKGLGDRSTNKGIYDFRSCKNVGLVNCACERCFGNGILFSDSSFINVNGLLCYSLRSEYKPPYNYMPNWSVGYISTGDSYSYLDINNFYAGGFENTYIKNNNPSKNVAVIGYNYSVESYGNKDFAMIKATNVIQAGTEYPLFAGHAYKINPLLCYNAMAIPNQIADLSKQVSEFSLNDRNITSKLNFNGYMDYGCKSLSATNGNTIIIPFKGQGNENVVGFVEILGINNAHNESFPYPFKCSFSLSSLSSISNVKLIDKSDDGITVESSGLNVKIKLHKAYNNILLKYSVLRNPYLDSENIQLITE